MEKQVALDYEEQIGAPLTDCLTGLFNHGFFQVNLEREVKRSKRYATPFALGLIGIDSFKLYNKQHGPVLGDMMLKEIAGWIKKSVRESDLSARFEGDLFAVILTSTTLEHARTVAERIRSSVENYASPALTVSIGLAAYPQDSETADGILQKARDALDRGKIKGKNCVSCFEKEAQPTAANESKILIVDDAPLNLKLLEALLIPLKYGVIKAADGEKALSIVAKTNVDLILLDIMMPGMDGYEVCRRLKENPVTRMIPVILITALDDIDSKIKGIEAGADDFITKPPNKLELLARTKSLIRLKKLNNNLTSIENVLFSLAKTVEAKDAYTQGHIERVACLAEVLGIKMELPPKEQEALKFGGILHDIGKIGMPNEILNKPGPLNDEEWLIMKAHPDIGYKICLPLKNNLGPALDVIRHHHEKIDGSGYPDGLKGDEISVVARIMAVADIYDALITDRPYRKGMPTKKAFGILHEEARAGKLDMRIVHYLIEYCESSPL